MPTPNYSYEKRQRELAKKRKAEEKRLKKTQPGQDGEAAAEPDVATPSQALVAPVAPSASA